MTSTQGNLDQVTRAGARTAHLQPALLNLEASSEEIDFWKIKHSYAGAEGSTITISQYACVNGASVAQRHYCPRFGASIAAAVAAERGGRVAGGVPKSTYSVYTGIHGLPDVVSKAAAIALIKEEHPAVNEAALQKAAVTVWSPDGEGALFMDFGDLEVEDALAFAHSLDAQVFLGG